MYTSFPGPIPPTDTQGESSFDHEQAAETAGARRRRQRLYPRLAKYDERQPSSSLARTTQLNVEELLSGSLNPGPNSAALPTINDASLQATIPGIPTTNAQDIGLPRPLATDTNHNEEDK